LAAAFYLPRFPFRDNRLNIRCLPQLGDRHTAGHGRVGTAFSHGSRAANHGFSAYQRRIYDVVRIFGNLDLVASGAGREQRRIGIDVGNRDGRDCHRVVHEFDLIAGGAGESSDSVANEVKANAVTTAPRRRTLDFIFRFFLG
jgi:hypothetical protein